jgi:group I intron endonuclease
VYLFGVRKSAGVYSIKNLLTGDLYIGSSSFLRSRKNGHFSLLRRGRHKNPDLQTAFDKHGENAFYFEILTLCPPEQLLKEEQRFVDEMKPAYNIAKAARSTTIYHHTDETKKKIAQTSRGRRMSEEAKRKIGEASKLRNAIAVCHTPEARAKLRATLKGMPRNRNGYHHSDETRSKISLSNVGKHSFKFSEDHKKKIGDGVRRAIAQRKLA